jgi:hypothetical protein
MSAQSLNPPSAEPGIDDAALYKQLEFKPHSKGQSEYLFSTARFNIPCCGRRWGKSQAAGRRMTRKLFERDTYNWICCPSYRLGEKEFRVVWDDFQKLGILKYCKKGYSLHQGDMYIDTPWNSHLLVVSAERQDSLLGEGLSHVIMSEAARHSRNTWEQFIEPALSDLRGTADFPSTPQGFNWFHGLYELGQAYASSGKLGTKSGEAQNYRSWRFPTWDNIIRYPGGFEDIEIQRLKERVSDNYFRQEYGAEFTALTGAIYDEWDEKIHVQPCQFNPDIPNYQAFDYGFSNPFVCLDVQISPSDDIYVWREYVERYRSNMEHGAAIKNRANPPGYRVDGRWGDFRDPDAAATLGLIIGYVASMDVPWKWGVEQIKQFLKARKLFVDPSCTATIQSLSQLHVKPPSKSGVSISETAGDGNIQHKIDDHCADALRYLIGPLYAMGAGSHFTDVYDLNGKPYQGSESDEFFKLHSGVSLDANDANIFTRI